MLFSVIHYKFANSIISFNNNLINIMCMSILNPSIELEKQLNSQIYTALQGEIVEEVLRKTIISSRDAYWRSNMEGHSLKVQKELLPDFYELCQSVK